MGKKNSDSNKDSIRYHESNLANKIKLRESNQAKKEAGEDISESSIERLDRIIADIEKTIYNYRTKGKGYD